MTGGSRQLRCFRNAIRDGLPLVVAAVNAGITLAEAELILRDDLRNPPGPECFEPIKSPTAARGKPMPKHDDIAPSSDDDFDPLIEMASDTLRGDVRDALLGWIRALPKAWPYMSETEQRDAADAADRFSREITKRACSIIAANERPCIIAKLVEYKEKDGVEAKLKLASTGEVVAQLHEACGREVLLVASGYEDVEGERGEFVADADQPNFPNLGSEYDDQ